MIWIAFGYIYVTPLGFTLTHATCPPKKSSFEYSHSINYEPKEGLALKKNIV